MFDLRENNAMLIEAQSTNPTGVGKTLSTILAAIHVTASGKIVHQRSGDLENTRRLFLKGKHLKGSVNIYGDVNFN